MLSLLLFWAAHTVGVSQGTVTLNHGDDANADLVVEVELVFARADADAFVAAAGVPVRITTANGVDCPQDPASRDDVEEDGRALRLVARCPRNATAVDVDVTGLLRMPEQHRLLLRILDDGGDRATMLWSASTTTALVLRPPPRGTTWTLIAALLAAVLALCLWGARRLVPAAMTAGGAVAAGAAVAMAPAMAAPPVAVLVTVAVVAAASVLTDRAPRVRPVAWALAAALVWVLRST